MKECSIFERDGIGDTYATAEARAILNREDALLGDEERALKGRLLAFEEHFLTCEACLARVREYQDLRTVFQRLGESGVAPRRRWAPRVPYRWLAAAASILLVSTAALTVWVGLLSQQVGKIPGPQAVADVYDLEPASPSQRTAGPRKTTIPSHDTSFLLAVEVSRTETNARRYVVRIIDGEGHVLFRNGDAPVAPSGRLYVHIAPDFLAPGAYSLEVQAFQRRDGEALAVASFPFLVDGDEADP